MGRPQFTAPPEAFSTRKFARNVLLGSLASFSTYALLSLDGLTGPLAGLFLFVLLVSTAWYVDQPRGV